MFCEDCLGLSQDPALLTDALNYTLKPSLAEFRKSAADGCSLCEVLLHHIETTVSYDWSRDKLAEGPIQIKAWPYPSCSGEVIVEVSRDNKGLSRKDFSFSVSIS